MFDPFSPPVFVRNHRTPLAWSHLSSDMQHFRVHLQVGVLGKSILSMSSTRGPSTHRRFSVGSTVGNNNFIDGFIPIQSTNDKPEKRQKCIRCNHCHRCNGICSTIDNNGLSTVFQTFGHRQRRFSMVVDRRSNHGTVTIQSHSSTVPVSFQSHSSVVSIE